VNYDNTQSEQFWVVSCASFGTDPSLHTSTSDIVAPLLIRPCIGAEGAGFANHRLIIAAAKVHMKSVRMESFRRIVIVGLLEREGERGGERTEKQRVVILLLFCKTLIFKRETKSCR
jgi:hypothetical protein